MKRLTLGFEVFASVLTILLAVLALAGSDRSHLVGGTLFALALLWSALPLLAHIDVEVRRAPDTISAFERLHQIGVGTAPDAAVTTIVRLGDEPLEVARTTILLAARSGTTLVVATRQPTPQLTALGTPVHVAENFAAALEAAISEVSSAVVHIVSARSVPCPEACRYAATLMTDQIAWATGHTEAFHHGGFVPSGRDGIDSRLRAEARSHGVVLWEPDATLIATEALRAHPVEHGKPWGAWLREREQEGSYGIEVADALARRAAPLHAEAFWPDTVSRQWGRVADLTGAVVRATTTRRRLLAAGLLARDLFALPLLIWAGAPLLLDGPQAFPFGAPAALCVALVAIAALARWASLRHSLGVALHPVRDAIATAHAVPGSLAALWALFTRRMPSSRLVVPRRPLVWASLLLTIVTGFQLVSSSSQRPSNVVIAMSIATLGLLWIYSMSALVQRKWERNTFRIPLTLPLDIAGVSTEAVDGSPSGLALRGAPELVVSGNEPITIRADLGEGDTLEMSGVLAGRRRIGDREILGFHLELDDEQHRRWLGVLDDAARQPSDPSIHRDVAETFVEVEPLTVAGRARRIADRAVTIGAAVASLAVAAILVLIMFGVRPLVIRSGSMSPTLSIGDVVLSETVRVTDLRVGDIATLPTLDDEGNLSLTHRVVRVSTAPGGLLVETRGDANSTDEQTIVSANSMVGRTRWTIPLVGTPATAVRNSTAQLALALVALGLVVGALLRSARATHRSPAPAPLT